VEKAHPDVIELFYQVFDKGRLEDGEGVEVDFKNTIILLTSNIGTETIMKACRNGGRPDVETLVEAIRPELLQHFKPALLGRLTIVPYYPLGDVEIRGIVRLKLGKIQKRFQENHRAELMLDENVVTTIAARCTEVDSGARNVDHILTQTLLPELSSRVLERIALESPFWSVRIGVDEGGDFSYKFVPPLSNLPASEPAIIEPQKSSAHSSDVDL
jgi:type VI secretion system protein VasG